MDYDKMVAASKVAAEDPKVGDRWSEMLSVWCYVVGRDGDTILTLGGVPPIKFPDGGTPKVLTLQEFKDSIGRYMNLIDRGNDVAGWTDGKFKKVWSVTEGRL